MEQKLDLWSGCAVFVSAIAIVVWAGATTLMIGDTWVPWAAAGVVILAIGSAVIRAWVKAKDVVWTEELRAGQRRRAYRMLRELLPIFLLSLGQLC
jgi:drug/metabolite transporter (DMT)-like permease